MWGIWMYRNARVFLDVSTPNSFLVARVERWVEEYGKYAGNIYGGVNQVEVVVVNCGLGHWGRGCHKAECGCFNIEGSLVRVGICS